MIEWALAKMAPMLRPDVDHRSERRGAEKQHGELLNSIHYLPSPILPISDLRPPFLMGCQRLRQSPGAADRAWR